MYLSRLQIDVRDAPPRPGRLWLRNLYRVHQRLCMAFPSESRKDADRDFLAEFNPKDFPEMNCGADKCKSDAGREALEKLHAPRCADRGFLFRVEPTRGSSVPILVQSATKPDWEYAFHNAQHFLAAAPEVKPYNPSFIPGQRLQFRLLANPVRKVSKNSRDAKGRLFDPQWIGKDVPVPEPDLKSWLERRTEPAWTPTKNSESAQLRPGFKVIEYTSIETGYVYVSKSDEDGKGTRRRTVRYDGILEVTDSESFAATIAKGIGPAKAFGFGLLSVAPV